MAPGTEEMVKETAKSDSDDTAHARSASPDAIRDRVIEQLKTVFDPEIPVNIYELGLIYNIGIDPTANVAVDMTLTSPACPVAESLPGDVEGAVRGVSGVGEVKVELVWDPPWDQSRMSELRDRLLRLSQNLWWSWHDDLDRIFRAIDLGLWREVNHNPIAFLNRVDPEELRSKERDTSVLALTRPAYQKLVAEAPAI